MAMKIDAPQSLFCSICGTPAETFEPEGGQPNRLCLQCKSLERHRVFMDLYKSQVFPPNILKNKRVLRISPSNAEKTILRQIPGVEDITLDIRPHKKTKIVSDISNMPTVATGAFDLVFACQVFSHVEHFPEAISELFRVLKPGGAILCSDFLWPGGKTIEHTDMSKITSYYGKEEYEQWHVGSFRCFGELDYAEQFSPYFEGIVYYGNDIAISKRVGWYCGVMNSELISTSHRRKAFLYHVLRRSNPVTWFK
jgi:SAM-dependent methyltransferase